MRYRVVASFLTCLLTLLLTTGCSSIEELKIGNFRNVEIESIQNNVANVKVIVPIENPNRFILKIKEAKLSVITGNKELGKISQMDKLVIHGKSNEEYTLHFSVELTDAANNLMSAISLFGGKKPEIRLKGTVKTGSFLYSRTIVIDQKLPINL